MSDGRERDLEGEVVVKVVVYTRQGCHLCEEAEALLVRHGVRAELVDIDADAALRERYNECVPVVEIDGEERFQGRVNEVLLRRLLTGRGFGKREG